MSCFNTRKIEGSDIDVNGFITNLSDIDHKVTCSILESNLSNLMKGIVIFKLFDIKMADGKSIVDRFNRINGVLKCEE